RDVRSERGRAPLDAATQNIDVVPHRSSIETEGVRKQRPDAATRERSSLRAHVALLFSQPLNTNVGAQRRTFRAAVPMLLLAAVAISVYYVYRYPVQFSNWLTASQSDPSPPSKANPGGTRTPSFPAQIGMAPPPPPQASPGTDSVSTSGSAGAVPSFQPPTEVITSSISRGGTRAIANDVNGEMPT